MQVSHPGIQLLLQMALTHGKDTAMERYRLTLMYLHKGKICWILSAWKKGRELDKQTQILLFKPIKKIRKPQKIKSLLHNVERSSLIKARTFTPKSIAFWNYTEINEMFYGLMFGWEVGICVFTDVWMILVECASYGLQDVATLTSKLTMTCTLCLWRLYVLYRIRFLMFWTNWSVFKTWNRVTHQKHRCFVRCFANDGSMRDAFFKYLGWVKESGG